MLGVDVLHGFADLAADNVLLLLFVVIGVGSAVGRLRWRGISLGPAAVLFVALALSAYDERLGLPAAIGQLGLVLFAYTIGVAAGPSFFETVRTGGRALVVLVGALLVGAAATVGVGLLLGLDGPVLSGVYAGSLTNTPALAASLEQLDSTEPTVGYSVTYVFGVLGMLVAAGMAMRTTAAGRTAAMPVDAPPPRLDQRTVRVDSSGLPTVLELEDRYGREVVFSRVMRGDRPGHPGEVSLATDELRPEVGDILTFVGTSEVVERVVADLGHESTVALVLDRSELDFRRITVSKRAVAGRSLGELRLLRRFAVTPTRVRRGDVDLLAAEELVLQLGDRVRLVGRREQLAKAAAFLGDSERAASDLNPVGLALGISLGLLLGLVEIPVPGGTFELGLAAGPLLVGLLLGRTGRTGRVVWTLPYQASAAVNQLGMLLFLAYAGSTAGPALADALTTSAGPRLLVTGVAVTALTAATLLLVAPRLAGAHGPRLAGEVAGAGTQPAVLAYADEKSAGDPRVNLGYALVYPVAMIVKVIVAPLLGTVG